MFSAELTSNRYWLGPRAQEVGRGGGEGWVGGAGRDGERAGRRGREKRQREAISNAKL